MYLILKIIEIICMYYYIKILCMYVFVICIFSEKKIPVIQIFTYLDLVQSQLVRITEVLL